MNLPSPHDPSLADCLHLARFVAKARLFLNDELEEEYAAVFGHKLGVDGQFLTHFEFEKDAFVEAVEKNDDAGVVAWLENAVSDFETKKRTWNELAPELGREGKPMHRVFRLARKRIYKEIGDPPPLSVFEMIDRDEGRI